MGSPANLCPARNDVCKDPGGGSVGFVIFDGRDFVIGDVVDAETFDEDGLTYVVFFLVGGAFIPSVLSGEIFRG